MRSGPMGWLRRWEPGLWAGVAALAWAGGFFLWYWTAWRSPYADHYEAMLIKSPGLLAAAALWYWVARRSAATVAQRRIGQVSCQAFLVAGLSPLVWLGYWLLPPSWGISHLGNPLLVVFCALLLAWALSLRRLWVTPLREVPFFLDFALVMVTGLLVEWALVLGPALSRGVFAHHVDLVVSPMVDLVLLAGLAATWLTSRQPFISTVSLLHLSLICIIAGDTLWMSGLVRGWHASDSLFISCWVAGALLGVMGACLGLRRAVAAVADEPVGPYPWRTLALVTSAFAASELTEWIRPANAFIRYASAAIAALVIIRLAVSLIHSHRLNGQLERSEARFRSLVQSSSEAIVVLDTRGNVLYQSTPAVALLDLIAGHQGQGSVTMRVHPDDAARVLDTWKQVSAGPGQSRRIRYRVLEADGSWHRISAVATNLLDNAYVSGVIWHLRDVSEQEMSEERWRSLVQMSPTLIYTAEPRFPFTITFVSQHIKEMLGYPPDEVLANPHGYWDWVHKQDLPDAIAAVTRAVQTDEIVSVEMRLRQTDGTYRWFRNTVRRITDAGGRPTEIIGNLVDLTVIRELTTAMQAANVELERRVGARTMALEQELEERLRAEDALRKSERERALVQDRFLQVAAHELRNPLAGVMSMLSVLRLAMGAGKPPEQLDVMADATEQEVARLAALLEEILNAFRTRDGQLPLKPTRIDLVGVVMGALRPFTARDPVRFRFVCDTQRRYWTDGDANRLEEVFRNLLGNAAKYSAADGDVTVRLYTSPDGGEQITTVTDHGFGIPADQLASIFDGFVRGKNLKGRDPGGMGLGLYICREIVRQHGGRIWADSVVGRGTTFYVALPVCGERTENPDDTYTDCGG